MAGHSGQLFTGHCVIRMLDGAAVASRPAEAVTTVRFGVPAEAVLTDYLASGASAGSSTVWTAIRRRWWVWDCR